MDENKKPFNMKLHIVIIFTLLAFILTDCSITINFPSDGVSYIKDKFWVSSP